MFRFAQDAIHIGEPLWDIEKLDGWNSVGTSSNIAFYTVSHDSERAVEMTRNNPYYNSEGYADPTAFEGLKDVIREETETEKKCNFLIKVLKFIIKESGFELLNRIELKHTDSGRVFK